MLLGFYKKSFAEFLEDDECLAAAMMLFDSLYGEGTPRLQSVFQVGWNRWADVRLLLEDKLIHESRFRTKVKAMFEAAHYGDKKYNKGAARAGRLAALDVVCQQFSSNTVDRHPNVTLEPVDRVAARVVMPAPWWAKLLYQDD